MTEPLTVMVTGVGGTIGQGLMKAARMADLPMRIVATDMHALGAGLFRADAGYVVPPVNDPTCLERICAICRAEDVQAICVGSDAETEFFANHAQTIEAETSAVVLTNPPEVVAVGRDKWRTVEFLRSHGLNYPNSLVPDPAARGRDAVAFACEEVGFPIVLKPRKSSGAKNFHVIDDEESLRFYLPRVPEPIVQEYLPDDAGEYTSGTFVCTDGTVAGIITMKRLLKKGDTFEAEVGEFSPVAEEMGRILKVLGVRGVCNFQMRLTPRGAVTFEINPRFSGSAVMRAYYGFNEVEAALRHFVLGQPPQPLEPKAGMAVRFYQELYLLAEDVAEIKARGVIEGPRIPVEGWF